MKSYARFKKDLTEAVPLAAPLLAPLVPKIVGGAAAAVGLGGMIHQATKQGQGGRSQPADYGQGGTATPRGKSVQRGKLSSNDAYNRAKAEEKRRDRRLQRQSGDAQHGPSFEKAAQEAAKRREQNRSQRPLTPDERLDRLIDKAAKNIGVKLPK
jgi:hypothetical protein